MVAGKRIKGFPILGQYSHLYIWAGGAVGGTQGLTHAGQALYDRATPPALMTIF
jgi:hypothetical protein